jgi:hypothetical protein
MKETHVTPTTDKCWARAIAVTAVMVAGLALSG